jgi:hypothetical protein
MGKKKNAYVLLGKYEVKLSLERPSNSLEDNIEMGSLEIQWEDSSGSRWSFFIN